MAGEQSLTAHKFILRARSHYLHAHFQDDGRWRNKTVVQLSSDFALFDLILRWLYVDNLETDLQTDELKALLILAQRLKLDDLPDHFLDDTRSKREKSQLRSRAAQGDMERYVDEEIISKAMRIKDTTKGLDSTTRKMLLDKSGQTADALIGVIEQSDTLVYAVSKSMLIKSDFFLTALTSGFSESHVGIPYFTLDTTSQVAELVLRFLYADRVTIPRSVALDTLEVASYLLLSKDRSLKSLAAIAVTNDDKTLPPGTDVYAILRMAWHTETPRLEQYAAKYIAHHLDEFMYEQEFADIVQESASRITNRQETDTIELIDDIRFYLSEAYGIYLGMNTADEHKRGESIEEDLWVPLTVYEVQYNEQLAKLDDLLGSMSLDA